MSVAQLSTEETNPELKRVRVNIQHALSFSDKNKIETIQPHDNALVVTLKIEGYDVKRVMVDQGSGVEIMYLDLYKGLNLRPEETNQEPKRVRVNIQHALSFSDKDKIETIQPHDNASVVTLKIEGYDVKRVMVDQGSGVEIMYLDLYKGLNLRLEDLTAYNFPLVSFDGKVVVLRGQIRLPMQASSEVVEVDFIVVDAYSPYTAIVARP